MLAARAAMAGTPDNRGSAQVTMASELHDKSESPLIRTARSVGSWVKRVEIRTAVYALAVLGLALGVVARLYPTRPDGTVLTAADIPAGARPIAYALFVLLIWAAMRVCMRLIPHVLHYPKSWSSRLLWLCVVILALPIGPLVYYLIVFRKSEVESEAGPR
jgi:hypothetical protein